METVSEYIENFPKEVQSIIKKMRTTIKKAAPKAEEGMAYRMPAYKLYGPLVYFAAYKNHIGFYPTPAGMKPFKKELAGYKCSKGAIQFPLDEKIPWSLITKIVKRRASELTSKKRKRD